MNNEKALKDLIRITNENLGYKPCTPSDFNQVIISIRKKTGQTISQSSIKRLWGYVHYSNTPSQNILNVLSRFNDFDDWDDYLRRYGQRGIDESSHFIDENMIESDSLTVGDKLTLRWEKDKDCMLEYLGDHRYKVMDSHNIKLLKDDEFTMHSITVGLPFFAADINRGIERIPGYIGARSSGIKSIYKSMKPDSN